MGVNAVTFAAMTDLHLDIMHDGMMRIDAFLNAAQKADVDFIIQLGDFSYPKDTSTCLCAPEKMPINLMSQSLFFRINRYMLALVACAM